MNVLSVVYDADSDRFVLAEDGGGVRWQGEMIHPQIDLTSSSRSMIQPDEVHVKTALAGMSGVWTDARDLQRIGDSGDAYLPSEVNIGCRFIACKGLSPSLETEEYNIGDRVFVWHDSRWRPGRVLARRIHNYDILHSSKDIVLHDILPVYLRPRDKIKHEKPASPLAVGDRVTWTPVDYCSLTCNDQKTYTGRILHISYTRRLATIQLMSYQILQVSTTQLQK